MPFFMVKSTKTHDFVLLIWRHVSTTATRLNMFHLGVEDDVESGFD